MDSYKILWKRSAEKDLKSIDRQFIPHILEVIEHLADEPFKLKYRKLMGTESCYRIRIGDYRVIYQIDAEKKLIVIYHVRHRKDVYRRQV